jgi:hypothetical protein
MPDQADSFFRIFTSDFRGPLRRFFENREAHINPSIAQEFADQEVLGRLTGLELLEFDTANNEIRLDDRAERFIEEMLGASAVLHADWLTSNIDELHRLITGFDKLSDPLKGETLVRRMVRVLRNCESRSQRHLEDIRLAIDIDYRAGSDYEVKLFNLEGHLARTRAYGDGVANLDSLLRNNAFFQIHRSNELTALRNRLVRQCRRLGDLLIDIYQRIEEYLNQVIRDHERTRKLIRLRGIISRQEHRASTNIDDVVETCDGPLFREFRFRSVLDPRITDENPTFVARVLRNMGIAEEQAHPRPIELDPPIPLETSPIIDWEGVFEAFLHQRLDLFRFLGTILIDGRTPTDEERLDGFCSILSTKEWMSTSDATPFLMGVEGLWDYAIILPPRSVISS